MIRRARIDPRLEVRVIGAHPLRYSQPSEAGDDRPPHVRAASGLAVHGGRLVVIQDDNAFIAEVAGDNVSAIKLPRGLHGRRRFEVALGNKHQKLDLESCVVIERPGRDSELWAFGSGSLPIREQICIVRDAIVRVRDAAPLYRRMRDALGGPLNLEGAARVRDELWLFHRGNTGPTDRPAVLRLPLAATRDWLDAQAELPVIGRVDGFDLGSIDGHPLGFTDAYALDDRVLGGARGYPPCVLYLATAEATSNAVDDGAILGSQLGVIDLFSVPPSAGAARSSGAGPIDATGTLDVRAAPLTLDGHPIKAEGIALDPHSGGGSPHAWIVTDPDDPSHEAMLLKVALKGPWLSVDGA